MKWLSLHVGGQRWAVHLVKATDKQLGTYDDGCDGVTFLDKCKIVLSRDVASQAREDALIHELFHAAIFVSGAGNLMLDAVGRDEDAYEKLEEDVVRALTPIWHRLLKDLGFVFPKGPTE